jgi:hypothetical protein
VDVHPAEAFAVFDQAALKPALEAAKYKANQDIPVQGLCKLMWKDLLGNLTSSSISLGSLPSDRLNLLEIFERYENQGWLLSSSKTAYSSQEGEDNFINVSSHSDTESA